MQSISRFSPTRWALFLAALLMVAAAQPAAAQNLATRRLIEKAKTEQVPKCEQAVKEAASVAIPVEVDFATLGDEGSRFMVLTDILQGISDGMAAIAKDKAGKEAVAAKVKKIAVVRAENYKVELKDGTLTVAANFANNFSSTIRDKVVAQLEQSL